MQRTLLIFARQPIPGQTKTRLCPPLALATAAALYECFLRDVLLLARQIAAVRPVIAYTPDTAGPFFEHLAPDLEARPQCGDGLGARLEHALSVCLRSRPSHVAAIGSDSPNLPAGYLRRAFACLDDGADVVLGPSDDGGYYLIGLRAPQPPLLREVPMSTPTVLADTLELVQLLKLRARLLPTWYDVDTAEDLRRLAADLRSQPADIAPNTRAFSATIV